jgi:hypothetical protein
MPRRNPAARLARILPRNTAWRADMPRNKA